MLKGEALLIKIIQEMNSTGYRSTSMNPLLDYLGRSDPNIDTIAEGKWEQWQQKKKSLSSERE